ncbi:MAG: hypothetical protein J5706_07130 [Elusimicrobiales bacterium]|nr:hypothetical protein [Elusimicrobiales bacterium]
MVNLTRQQAMRYRKAMTDGAQSLTDEEALTAPMLYERWAEGKEYAVDQRLYHDGKLWRVLIGHVSQAQWTPDVSPSLFAEVLIPDPTEIPEWVQPSSTNPYMTGDKVRHNDKVWISTVDNNVWEPGVYGWDEVTA